MAMTRASHILVCGLLLVTCGCSAVSPRPQPSVDCSVMDPYHLLPIADFLGGDSNWFSFADSTPGGLPNLVDASDTNLHVSELAAPGRCGDTGYIELKASGHNFYGVGFGDYALSNDGADGTGYLGISFWARSNTVDRGGTDNTFMLYLDDEHTIVLPPDPTNPLNPGDTAPGTKCQIPPPQSISVPTPACYSGGVLPPGTPPRVPASNECGNQFHTYITVTSSWQFFTIPWSELGQWPCPNREPGGIDFTDIRQIEIKFIQGTDYDLWIDNFDFYQPRTDGGS
jgi:hypothetical protein